MKTRKLSNLLALAVIGSLAPLTQINAALSLPVNFSPDGATPRGLGSFHASGTTFTTDDTFTSGTDLAIAVGLPPGGANLDVAPGPYAWTDGAYSGVIQISLDISATGSPTDTLTATPISRGGRGAFGIESDAGTASLMGVGEGTMTISNLVVTKVSGDDFTVDGFTGIYLGNSAAGGTTPVPTATTNGAATNNFDTAGTTTAAGFNAVTLASSLEVDGTQDQFSINGAQIQITGVPEPSSAALLGLGGLALILRRRR